MAYPKLVSSFVASGATHYCITRDADDIHDGLWEHYVEDGGNMGNDHERVAYVVDNAVNYLEDIIFATESE